ncbi:MAG: DUF5686 family protein, partial [Flavobacteriales bacterium]
MYFIDSATNDAVAFASVVHGNKYIGSVDVDGKILLPTAHKGTTLTVKSVGYKTTSFVLNHDKQVVYLPPFDKQMDEVVIVAGENPAHRIIRMAIDNREKNDPEQCCRFTYESYNKLVFFLQTDSIEYRIKKTNDTSMRKLLEFTEKSHFFLTESVTEKKHIPPDQDNEKVIAARVSGFSNPIFAVLSTELQSFSFYNDYVSLLGERYLSPLCPGSINKYLFLISDTLIEGADSVYILTFQPRKNKSFKALQGEIHISTRGFAISGIKAEPAGAQATMGIKIQQLHSQIDGVTWFPAQLNARIVSYRSTINGIQLIGEATGYIRNIKLNAHVRNRDIEEVDLEMPDAGTQHEKLLQEYRVDSLNEKEKYTYRFIDSLSKKENLEKKMNRFTSFLYGKIPLGPFDIDLNKLMDYNNYEGYRLGLGLYTSRRLLKWAHVGGYGAYGFKDKEFKYGGEVAFHIYPKKDIHLVGSYQLDLLEAASPMLFPVVGGALSEAGIRELYLSRFDMSETIEARFKTRLFRHFGLQAFARTVERQPRYTYSFLTSPSSEVTLFNEHFSLFETGCSMRFKLREKFFYTGETLVSKGSKWPALTVEYIRAWSGLLNGGWNLERIKIQLDHAFTLRHMGRLLVYASYTETGSAAPYFYLIHPASTYAKVGLSAANTFETMRPYEFTVNKGYALHVTHQFLSALFHKGQKKGPQLELCGSAFYGELRSPQLHTSLTLQAPLQVYTEAGFRLKRLIKSNFSSFGAGVFYRFGPNAFSDWKQNIA